MLFHLSRGDVIFASPYMAVVKTPFSNHFKNYNAKSIKPNHYSYGKFNNYKLRYANKKGKGQSDLVLSTLPFYKQNVRTLYIINAIKYNQMEINGNFYCTIL